MEKLFTVLAWTSLIVSLLPNLFNFIVFVGWFYLGGKGKLIGGYGIFVWLALLIWPIVYFIVY